MRMRIKYFNIARIRIIQPIAFQTATQKLILKFYSTVWQLAPGACAVCMEEIC